jgi:exonuclease VII small subunit
MEQCAGKRDHDGFDAASKEFERAMKLYDLASEVLCQRD